MGANLIALPTAGHHRILDALRGSTTEPLSCQGPARFSPLPSPHPSARGAV
jgi:hypothetical protein